MITFTSAAVAVKREKCLSVCMYTKRHVDLCILIKTKLMVFLSEQFFLCQKREWERKGMMWKEMFALFKIHMRFIFYLCVWQARKNLFTFSSVFCASGSHRVSTKISDVKKANELSAGSAKWDISIFFWNKYSTTHKWLFFTAQWWWRKKGSSYYKSIYLFISMIVCSIHKTVIKIVEWGNSTKKDRKSCG